MPLLELSIYDDKVSVWRTKIKIILKRTLSQDRLSGGREVGGDACSQDVVSKGDHNNDNILRIQDVSRGQHFQRTIILQGTPASKRTPNCMTRAVLILISYMYVWLDNAGQRRASKIQSHRGGCSPREGDRMTRKQSADKSVHIPGRVGLATRRVATEVSRTLAVMFLVASLLYIRKSAAHLAQPVARAFIESYGGREVWWPRRAFPTCGSDIPPMALRRRADGAAMARCRCDDVWPTSGRCRCDM